MKLFYFFPRRKLIFTAFFAFGLAVMDIVAQLADKSVGSIEQFSFLHLCFTFVIGAVVCFLMLTALDYLPTAPKESQKEKAYHADLNGSNRKIWIIPLITFLVTFFSWFVLYLRYWPFVSMNDTYWILLNPLGSANHHPLVYNIWLKTLVEIGTSLFGSEARALAFAGFVQMFLWAVAISFVVWYLLKLGVRTVLVSFFIAYCAFFPLVGDYTFALVKDSYFSLFVLLLIPVMLETWRTRGKVLNKPIPLGIIIMVLLGFAVTRNNGKLALPVVLLLLVVYAAANRRRAIVISTLIFVIAMIPSVVSTKVAGEQKFVESIGIPIQLVGAAVVATYGDSSEDNRNCFGASSEAYFNNILPLETWKSAFNVGTADTTKFNEDFSWQFLQTSKKEFLIQWVAVGLRCPDVYMSEYAVHTSQLWRVDAKPVGFGGQSYFSLPVTNESANSAISRNYADRGLVRDSKLPANLDNVIDQYVKFIGENTPGEGSWLWLALLAVCGFSYRRRKEWGPILLPAFLVWGTLLVSVPVAGPFRYAQYIILVVPIAYIVLFGLQKIDRVDETVSDVVDSKKKEMSLSPGQ